MDKKYRSDISMVVHESATDLFEIGAISEARMREFDKMCLVKESKTKPNPGFLGTESGSAEMKHVTSGYSVGQV